MTTRKKRGKKKKKWPKPAATTVICISALWEIKNPSMLCGGSLLRQVRRQKPRNVLTHDRAYVRLRKSCRQHCVGNLNHAAGIERSRNSAIKIRSERYMFRAHAVGNIAHRSNNRGGIGAAGCGVPISNADQPSLSCHGANLIVAKIAIVIASALYSGVRNQHGTGGHGENIFNRLG